MSIVNAQKMKRKIRKYVENVKNVCLFFLVNLYFNKSAAQFNYPKAQEIL